MRGSSTLQGQRVAQVWQPTTAVTTGAVRVAPDGSRIKSTSSRTTRASFDTTEAGFWTSVIGDPTTIDGKALTASIAGKTKVVEDDGRAIPYSRQRSTTIRPLVVFYFDDAPAADLTVVKPIADAKSIPVTIAAIADEVGQPGFLTKSDLLNLQAAGWQIDSHTKTHAHLATLTDAQIEAELRTSRDTLRDMGLNIDAVCYPFGEYDTRVTRIAAKFYRAGLASAQGTNVVPLRTHAMFRVHMKDYTLANMQARVDALATSGAGVLIFYSHSSPDWTSDDTDKFSSLIDYVKSKSIEIVTLDAALDALENRFEVIDNTYLSTAQKFIVGADGKVYGPQIEALNHVYLAPTGITDTTPITSFDTRKVTTTSFTTTSGSGISLGTSGAGTLVTYRINDDDLLNYQMFVPYPSTQGMAVRYWTSTAGGSWGPWRQYVQTGSGPAATYKSTVNAFAATAVYADFTDGNTIWDIDSSGATGFPATAGTVNMYRSPQGSTWSYQIFEGLGTGRRWKRWMTDGTTWAAWVQTTSGNMLTATAVLDFPSIAANDAQSLDITVTGAALGDAVFLGPPAAPEAGLVWSARVSAANTVKIRLTNTTASPIDPASATWRATVIKAT